MAGQSMPRCEFESSKLMVRFQITLAAEVKAISPVVNGVMKLVREMGCAAGKEHAVELALHEALANAVIHGCKKDPTKEIQCCVACDESRGLLIVVRDPGEGFDPAALPSPVTGQNIYSEHGRGIYLINQLMDEVHYERGGTEVHMRKY